MNSIRGGNIVGEHVVQFFGEYETFEIEKYEKEMLYTFRSILEKKVPHEEFIDLSKQYFFIAARESAAVESPVPWTP